MGNVIVNILNEIDSILYYPILLIVLCIAGIYFSIRTGFVQIRLFPEACRMVLEQPEDSAKHHVSSFQALMVSTASRVGTGNIIGVSNAICLGGPGALFWMWVMCIIGASSAFIESTLAQIYKKKDTEGGYYGGPAYYIEQALHAPLAASFFCIFLISTYAFGFNLLCSYNLQSTFASYGFYQNNPKWTPVIIGGILAIAVGYCLLGGGKRIVRLTSTIVPIMGLSYVFLTFVIILFHIGNIPSMFIMIFRDAFNFKAILGGVSGSCLILGIKRGLYSNEAGVGSAPNASASAHVSHPVKQGLVQTVSVYIDTLLLCTATGLMCLSSGVYRDSSVAGAAYVQNAMETVFGKAGPIMITCAMVLFAFTTLLGNLYYVDNALAYLNHKKMPSKPFMTLFYIFCTIVIFVGAFTPMDAAWALADITMGLMAFINLPSCVLLSSTALKALKHYEQERNLGINPVFHRSDIGLKENEAEAWD